MTRAKLHERRASGNGEQSRKGSGIDASNEAVDWCNGASDCFAGQRLQGGEVEANLLREVTARGRCCGKAG
jgi:hypothetical protein